MNTEHKHFHLIPNGYCNRNCPYCINKSIDKTIFSNDYYNKIIKFFELIQDKYKLVLEFNGGEFMLDKNIYDYIKKLKNIKIHELILTTNFRSSNNNYIKLLNSIQDLNVNKVRLFVSFHYDCDNKFIDKIKNFLEETKKFNFIFQLNFIKGNSLIESNISKYIKNIQELNSFENFEIVESQYIQVSNIKNNKTYNKTSKKLCKGGVYYIMNNSISDACRNINYSIDTLIKIFKEKNKLNDDVIYCDKTCPNQWFNEEIFSPKFFGSKKDRK